MFVFRLAARSLSHPAVHSLQIRPVPGMQILLDTQLYPLSRKQQAQPKCTRLAGNCALSPSATSNLQIQPAQVAGLRCDQNLILFEHGSSGREKMR